jgi:DNA (cytosine-5)-methyltransferase 1
MIGFLDPKAKSRFVEPKKIKLDKLKLGQILGGHVDREIGWTLRVGGRGSGLEDRRNWDTYEVDGEPKRIEWPEGLKLQGFPSSFKFPDSVPSSQRMKQLGNSVAVPAVMAYAKALVAALEG